MTNEITSHIISNIVYDDNEPIIHSNVISESTARCKIRRNTNENTSSFYCEKCDFRCEKKGDYVRHLKTQKHNNQKPILDKKYECECGKAFKHASSLWNHKKRCKVDLDNNYSEQCPEPLDKSRGVDTHLVLELLKQNQEFKELMIDQNKQFYYTQEKNSDLQKQLLDVVKDGKTVINNNTTNNRFNLNVFLNETCKDAINLNDFIQSIELNTEDFTRTGEIGYVKGISNIMVERIRGMEPHVRPIHCTDLKREIVYVKDSNKWSKEDDNKTHLRKAVRIIADKNKQQLYPWQEENPNYEILDTPECDKFFEYAKVSLGGYGKEEGNKFENKIISNLIKEAVIDKQSMEY